MVQSGSLSVPFCQSGTVRPSPEAFLRGAARVHVGRSVRMKTLQGEKRPRPRFLFLDK